MLENTILYGARAGREAVARLRNFKDFMGDMAVMHQSVWEHTTHTR